MNDLTINIKDKIYNIRGKQVMLDHDLAELYSVKLKRLNEQVKRNIERFPEEFMFQLTEEEYNSLRSQFATLETGRGKHKKYLPFVFTEQGVAMLTTVLNSDKAVKTSINIMKAFVAMRTFLVHNKDLFNKVSIIESKVLEHDDKINNIFNVLEKESLPKKGIFFDGQVFDAYKFITDLIKSADKNIILIDNYIDESVLALLSNKKKSVKVKVYTKNITEALKQAISKFNEQYKGLEIKHFNKSHDRFLIIDEELYHIGASLKDLGKKWFGFSKMNKESMSLVSYFFKKP